MHPSRRDLRDGRRMIPFGVDPSRALALSPTAHRPSPLLSPGSRRAQQRKKMTDTNGLRPPPMPPTSPMPPPPFDKHDSAATFMDHAEGPLIFAAVWILGFFCCVWYIVSRAQDGENTAATANQAVFPTSGFALNSWSSWSVSSPRGPLSIYRNNSSQPIVSELPKSSMSAERGQRLSKLSAQAVLKAEPEPGAASEQCVVCMEDIFAGEEVLRLPCNHRFHKTCVVDWLKSPFPASCPLCKSNPLETERKNCWPFDKPGSSAPEQHDLSA